MSTVLIVEDEKSIVDLISFNLKREGYEILEAYDGQKGLELALSGKADLMLLDVMLPLMDGFEVLKKLRETSSLPVIMVTAREEERDKILGLETGADDYITKPFSVKELAARIKANIRRSAGIVAASGGAEFGPFAIDRLMQTVSKNGKPLELSQREYDIISYFLKNPQGWFRGKNLWKRSGALITMATCGPSMSPCAGSGRSWRTILPSPGIS